VGKAQGYIWCRHWAGLNMCKNKKTCDSCVIATFIENMNSMETLRNTFLLRSCRKKRWLVLAKEKEIPT